MPRLQYPDRTYLLSDTFGGHKEWNPLEAPDIDARVVTDIRSGFRPEGEKFDIYGVPQITDHVLRAVLRVQQEECEKYGLDSVGTTGLFINTAPRTNGENGKPFYFAELESGLTVAVTPLEVLSCVKDKVRKLLYLPNEGNGLYRDGEQFRSSFTPRMLAENHGLDLVEDDPAEVIPDPVDGGLHVSYVDRFGNVCLYGGGVNDDDKGTIILSLDREPDVPGEEALEGFAVSVHHAENLGSAEPGKLLWHGNDGNIDVMSKWALSWNHEERLANSAYVQLWRPAIGTPVAFSTPTEGDAIRRSFAEVQRRAAEVVPRGCVRP